MLDRQPDAQKIQFDSQPESPARPAAKARPSKRANSSKPARSLVGVVVPTSKASVTATRERIARSASASVPPPEVSRRGVSVVVPDSETEGQPPLDLEPLGVAEEETLGDRFVTEVDDFDVHNREFGGGGDDAAQIADIDVEEEEEEAVPVKIKAGKGKGRAKDNERNRSRSPPAIVSNSRVVAPTMDEMFAQFAPRQEPLVAPLMEDMFADFASRREPLAGPSCSLAKNGKEQQRARGEEDEDGFHTDGEEEDPEQVRRNRRARRKEPGDSDDDHLEPRVPQREGKRRVKLVKVVGSDEEDDDDDGPRALSTTDAFRHRSGSRRKSSSSRKQVDSPSSGSESERDARRRRAKRKRPSYDGVVYSDEEDREAIKRKKRQKDNAGKRRNLYRQNRNGPGARVHWSDKEERCLMTAMNEMPYAWSKIMAKHGPNGTVDRILKYRTPVALKDKAVNIKISKLKAGHAIPYFLEEGEWS
jgi:hypothetical protein